MGISICGNLFAVVFILNCFSGVKYTCMRILLVFNVVFYLRIKIVTSIFINVKWLTLGWNWLLIYLHCVVP
jgi:hypothetical protein